MRKRWKEEPEKGSEAPGGLLSFDFKGEEPSMKWLWEEGSWQEGRREYLRVRRPPLGGREAPGLGVTGSGPVPLLLHFLLVQVTSSMVTFWKRVSSVSCSPPSWRETDSLSPLQSERPQERMGRLPSPGPAGSRMEALGSLAVGRDGQEDGEQVPGRGEATTVAAASTGH